MHIRAGEEETSKPPVFKRLSTHFVRQLTYEKEDRRPSIYSFCIYLKTNVGLALMYRKDRNWPISDLAFRNILHGV